MKTNIDLLPIPTSELRNHEINKIIKLFTSDNFCLENIIHQFALEDYKAQTPIYSFFNFCKFYDLYVPTWKYFLDNLTTRSGAISFLKSQKNLLNMNPIFYYIINISLFIINYLQYLFLYKQYKNPPKIYTFLVYLGLITPIISLIICILVDLHFIPSKF